MPKNNYIKYVLLVAVIILLGLAYGSLNALFSLENPDAYTKPEQPEEEIVAQFQKVVTTPDTWVRYVTSYTHCEHTIRSEEILDASLVGLSREEYVELVEDWRIANFTPEEILLERQIPGVCEDHYYVGIRDGYVTLFQGAPGLASTIVEQTEILVDKLPGEDRDMLEKGIIIESKEEYLQIREGLSK